MFLPSLGLAALLSVLPPQAQAQPPAAAPVDGIAALLSQVQTLVAASADAAAFSTFISPAADRVSVEQFFADLSAPGVTRAVVRERDRAPLDGVLPGDGFRLVVDFFTESATRGRIFTAAVDVRRPSRSDREDEWRFVDVEPLTTVDGLHRLSINPAVQFSARNLTIKAEDLQLVLQDGDVFVVESSDGVTGLVLFGRGQMEFSPAPEAEQVQVRIFGGSETLSARFDTAFIRLNPAEYESRVAAQSLTAVPVEARLLRRAQGVFAEDAPKSFSLDLTDLSRDTWYLLPSYGDFLAEIRTRGHGTLTYARSTAEPEDVTLFDRAKQRNIAIYASPQKLSARGRFYNEDDLTDYDILHHEINAVVHPERAFIEGRSRMRIRVRSFALATLTVRLAEPLAVAGVASTEHGRLLHLRVRNQNSIVINLPAPLPRDSELTLVIAYSGRLPSQGVDREALLAERGPQQRDDAPFIAAEPNYLLSNRAYWYPQAPVTDFATATIRITVPEGYACVASGELTEGSPRPVQQPSLNGGRQYIFSAVDPLRYLSFVVSRFTEAARTVVPVLEGGGADPVVATLDAGGRRAGSFRVRDRVGLVVQANPRQIGRGREMAGWADDILRFYSNLLDGAPYPTMTIALVENEVPGGHSPGYFAVLNTPLPTTPFFWRNDPANFSSFPEFFLAHELAHQWWGQAVGWKNYHEQWISEGFAQYFSALYAQKAHGDGTFVDMLRQFRRWSLAESDQGPIHLGYRLGHIKGDQKIFRALIYNKGAAVLHMLRRLVGDEAFFAALRRFYHENRFQKAGTDDLQRAFEAETGRALGRFFERWIYGSALPRLRYDTRVAAGEVVVRFVQQSDLVFDVPVTVTIAFTDGRSVDVVVPVTEAEVVHRIPVDGQVRSVAVNRDSGAVAHFDES